MGGACRHAALRAGIGPSRGLGIVTIWTEIFTQDRKKPAMGVTMTVMGRLTRTLEPGHIQTRTGMGAQTRALRASGDAQRG